MRNRERKKQESPNSAFKGHLKPRVLEEFKKCGTYDGAAKACGITGDTVLAWRNTDPEFEAALEGLRGSIVKGLETKALEMAQGGSEDMVKFLLKAENRRKYGERYDVAIVNGTLEKVAEVLTRLAPEKAVEIMREVESAADGV